MNALKRGRGSNFTTEEELMLLEEITKYKNKIECKTTNKVSNEEKEEAWKCVLNAFNAKCLRMRTMDQIKSKFDNLKSKTRKVVAADKLYIKGTGGGKCKTDYTGNPVIEAVLQIINYKTVVGLQSTFDCDMIGFDVTGSTDVEIHEPNTFENLNADSIILCEIQQSSVSSRDDQPISPATCLSFAVPSETNRLEGNVSPNRNPNNVGKIKVLHEVYYPPATPTNPPEKSTEKESTENWSTYVPRKLKMKTNSKLRPTAVNPIVVAKEAYYKRKLVLLEAAEEREATERAKRCKREEEEHLKKMTLLDLEIDIKKKS